VAAELGEYLTQDIVDSDIVPLYESLMQDKEPEVRSEAVT
jgi:serine/threonine-protein phosphatase 2A regulatory subunit A